MDDIIMAILFGLLAFVMGGFMIIMILVMIYGILDIIGEIVDWFVGRFGK